MARERREWLLAIASPLSILATDGIIHRAKAAAEGTGHAGPPSTPPR
jgi:hypothetical protein